MLTYMNPHAVLMLVYAARGPAHWAPLLLDLEQQERWEAMEHRAHDDRAVRSQGQRAEAER